MYVRFRTDKHATPLHRETYKNICLRTEASQPVDAVTPKLLRTVLHHRLSPIASKGLGLPVVSFALLLQLPSLPLHHPRLLQPLPLSSSTNTFQHTVPPARWHTALHAALV